MESLTKSFAAEPGPRRIRVNAVAPSLTDMIAGMPAAFREQITHATALVRLGTAPDIAGVVATLASPAGYWIKGQTLYADRGLQG